MDIFTQSRAIREWVYSKQLLQITNVYQLQSNGNYPMFQNMVMDGVMYAIGLTILRIILNSSLLQQIVSKTLKKPKVTTLPFENKALELIYTKKKFNLPEIGEIKEYSKQIGVSFVEIDKWFKIKTELNRFEVKVMRTKECIFRLLCYSFISGVGLFILMEEDVENYLVKPELSLMKIFENEPKELWMNYYTKLQIPLYLHLICHHVMSFESIEMFIHHLLVLFILSYCYLSNFLYIGVFSFVLHDVTDIAMESSRLLNYLGLPNTSAIAALLLNILWAVGRVYVFTTKVYVPLFFPATFYYPLEKGHRQYVADKVLGGSRSVLTVVVGAVLLLNIYWLIKITNITRKAYWSGVSKEKRERALTDVSTDDDRSEVETESEYSD